jgi:hypothetical protein
MIGQSGYYWLKAAQLARPVFYLIYVWCAVRIANHAMV